jgi:hypothetical protein
MYPMKRQASHRKRVANRKVIAYLGAEHRDNLSGMVSGEKQEVVRLGKGP